MSVTIKFSDKIKEELNGRVLLFIDEVDRESELENLYEIPAKIKEAIDNQNSMFACTLKDKTDFNSNVGSYISDSMVMDNGSVYYDGVKVLGDKTIYTYTIYNWNEADQGIIPEEVLNKLMEKINEALGMGMGEDPYAMGYIE